jgi:hypothetical protein
MRPALPVRSDDTSSSKRGMSKLWFFAIVALFLLANNAAVYRGASSTTVLSNTSPANIATPAAESNNAAHLNSGDGDDFDNALTTPAADATPSPPRRNTMTIKPLTTLQRRIDGAVDYCLRPKQAKKIFTQQTLIHPALLADLKTLRKVPPPDDAAALLYTESDFGGEWLSVYSDVDALPKGFSVASLRLRVPDGSAADGVADDTVLHKLALVAYSEEHFKGASIELFGDTSDVGDVWRGSVRSVAVRRRTAKKAAPDRDEYLIVTNRMLNKFIPGNQRVFDIAKAMRHLPGSPRVDMLTFQVGVKITLSLLPIITCLLSVLSNNSLFHCFLPYLTLPHLT